MIGGAVFFAMREPPPPVTPAQISFDGEDVIVGELYQSCAEGDRCIVVDTNCGFCCHYTAINARYEKEFNDGFDNSCRKYKGTMCSCFDLSSYPSCVAGKCQLVQWPAEVKDAPRPAPRQETPPQRVTPAVPERPQAQPAQKQRQAPSAPQTWPEPSEDISAPFDDAPPASKDDLYAPLPENMPSQGGDLYAPLGGSNSSPQGW